MLIPVAKDNYLHLATRSDWKAVDYRLKPAMLYPPVSWVRFSYTGTSPCHDHSSCGKMVRAIQETYLDNGAWDIPHSFLVGGDGVIYEGREWAFQPALPEEFHHLQNDCLDISYIGDYIDEDPPYEMMDIALKFIIHSVIKWKRIRPTFQVIPYSKLREYERKEESQTIKTKKVHETIDRQDYEKMIEETEKKLKKKRGRKRKSVQINQQQKDEMKETAER